MAAPLYKAMRAFVKKEKMSFHMPGHKRGAGMKIKDRCGAFLIDTTELSPTDNLHYPIGCIARAQEAAAKAVGAKETFFSVNGSSAAMETAIFSVCRRGDTIIADRNAHSCVMSAAILLELNVAFYQNAYRQDFGIPVAASCIDIIDAMDKNPQAKVVVVTSPNYYGLCADIKSISKEVHSRGLILIVDEAHGAHFPYCSYLPDSAVTSGADLVVQSAHKTLFAPTQSAFLHRCSDRVDGNRIRESMRLFLSSSPSYILMAYTDLARDWAEQHGEKAYKSLISMLEKEQSRLEQKTAVQFLKGEQGGCFAKDQTRVVANFSAYQESAKEIESKLQNFGIYAEMADMENIVFIVTPANTKREIHCLFRKLCNLVKCLPKRMQEKISISPPRYQGICHPSIAFHAGFESIPMTDAIGRISHRTICVYPPSTPVVAAGEEICEETVFYIEKAQALGLFVMGIEEGYIRVLID